MHEALRLHLTRNPLFRNLPDEDVARLSAVAVRRCYKKNERVFSQGDDGKELYSVVSGRVRINAVSVTGHDIFVRIFEPNETFGETAMIDGLPRISDAVAMESTVLIAIPRASLLTVLNDGGELSVHLLLLLCERVRQARDLVDNTFLLSPTARLATRVLSLAQHDGLRTECGIEIQTSQSDLSKSLGMTRQTVNRKLQIWRALGWISMARGRLWIIDVPALRRMANSDSRSDLAAK
jgi:CRP-like cAMP-binding protein